jgi:hypothetical protein
MGFSLDRIATVPSEDEMIANALATIREGLKGVADRRVWDVASQPGDSPGLVQLVEESVHVDADAWSWAFALKIAFELGRAAVVGKADPTEVAKFRAGVEARRRAALKGSRKGVQARQANAGAWHRHVREIWENEHASIIAAGVEASKTDLAKKIRRGDYGLIKGLPGEQSIRKVLGEWEAELLGNDLKMKPSSR